MRSIWKYPLGMALCCLILIALVAGLSGAGMIGEWGYYLMFLLCPLMHIMMPHHGHGDQDNGKDPEAGDGKCP